MKCEGSGEYHHDQPKGGGAVYGEERWVRIPDGTKVKFREDGREGIIDGLTQLVVGPSRSPDSLTQYRINVGDPTGHWR